jgi:hypothetical protein
MALDTQSFSISRWWAQAGLQAVKINPAIFSTVNRRAARRDLLAGTNMLPAIKNWLLASKLIRKDGNGFVIDRYGRAILENDPAFQSSSTWWAFHLLLCLSPDAYPYNGVFAELDPSVRSFVGESVLIEKIASAEGSGLTVGSANTYLDGILSSFIRGGALEGLGLLESRSDRSAGDDNKYWRLGSPVTPDGAILFAVALARERYFSTRTSIDFSELIALHVDHYLVTPQDGLRTRLKQIALKNVGLQYTANANLDSLSFDSLFSAESVLMSFLQEGTDTWM